VKVGILGSGNMGGGMARHLHANGVPANCHDVEAARTGALATLGIRIAGSARALARAVNLLILSLPDAAAVRQVTSGIGPALRPGTILVDASTSDPTVKRELIRQAVLNGESA